MAPPVVLMTWATPALPLPAWVSAGQFTVSPAPSVHVLGAAAVRYLVKLEVVPDPSARWATVIAVEGSFTPGLRSAISLASQVLTWRWKILAMVSASSTSLATPLTLYDRVIGAATVGKYSRAPPLN